MIEVNIPLFNIAAIELQITGESVDNPELFRLKGEELRERMYMVAEISEKLIKNKWRIVCEIFNLIAYKDEIKSVSEAKSQLKKLGIKTEYLFFTKYKECEENGEGI